MPTQDAIERLRVLQPKLEAIADAGNQPYDTLAEAILALMALQPMAGMIEQQDHR